MSALELRRSCSTNPLEINRAVPSADDLIELFCKQAGLMRACIAAGSPHAELGTIPAVFRIRRVSTWIFCMLGHRSTYSKSSHATKSFLLIGFRSLVDHCPDPGSIRNLLAKSGLPNLAPATYGTYANGANASRSMLSWRVAPTGMGVRTYTV